MKCRERQVGLCPRCNYEIEKENLIRCPRCNKILLKKCSECRKCSLFNF